MMRRLLLVIVAPVLALWAPASPACGYCVEDKVAAVYDHSVIVGALDRRHRVVFFAIEGPVATADSERRALEGSLREVPGVDAGSLRVSLASAALSFAFDPKRKALGPIIAGLERKLGPKGLSLSLLRVVEENERPR